MCLLDEVMEWDPQHICCRTGTHRLPDNPLRSHGLLGIACGIEYAAQAMAVHGALCAGAAPGHGPEVGLLASVREVRLHVLRLDDIGADLICNATRVAGDRGTALYEFALWSEAPASREARELLSGRAAVVLDAGNRLNL